MAIRKLIFGVFASCLFVSGCDFDNKNNAGGIDYAYAPAWSTRAVDYTEVLRYMAPTLSVDDNTIRTIIKPNISGFDAQVHLSKNMDSSDGYFKVAGAKISLLGDDGNVVEGTSHDVLFKGSKSITIANDTPDTDVVSDPISIFIDNSKTYAIDLYIEKATAFLKSQGGAAGYMSAGNLLGNIDSQVFEQSLSELSQGSKSTFYLSGLDVKLTENPRVIVAFGDSITTYSYPDFFMGRLKKSNNNLFTVVREAIAGNRLLRDSRESYGPLLGPVASIFGASGLSRFESAIRNHNNVSDVIVLIGINDIAQASGFGIQGQDATGLELIDGYKKLIGIARQNNVKIYFSTIMPSSGVKSPQGVEYYTADMEEARAIANDWIRTNRDADGFLDFDAAVRDGLNPSKMKDEYHIGDYLHPNDEGSKRMADSIDLSFFSTK